MTAFNVTVVRLLQGGGGVDKISSFEVRHIFGQVDDILDDWAERGFGGNGVEWITFINIQHLVRQYMTHYGWKRDAKIYKCYISLSDFLDTVYLSE